MFELFGTLVKPIVLFNSEIWGININKGLEQFNLYFMKIILGVKNRLILAYFMQRTGDILIIYIYAFIIIIIIIIYNICIAPYNTIL